MSSFFVRTVVSAAAAACVFAAVTEEAHANPMQAQPLNGYQRVGKDYSKNVSSGDFGAGFQIYSRAEAKDYDKMCASSDPNAQCANTFPIFKGICKAIWQSMHNGYCAQHGVGMTVEGKAGADATLFGKDFDLLDVGASAAAEPSGMNAQYGIYVGGRKVSGYGVSSSFSKDVELASMTLVSASSTFMLGPIPIDVEASAVGSLGINFGMNVGTAQLQGQAGPYAAIDGVFSAGLGTKGLSAGIEGDLLLVKLSTPANAQIAYAGGDRFTYNAGLDLVINSLDGSVSLYGQAGSLKKTWTIFDWTGLSYTKNLGSVSGTVSL